MLEPQTPQPSIRTSTSSSAGSGSGTATARASLGAVSVAARIVRTVVVLTEPS
jgi:hypothetical protein